MRANGGYWTERLPRPLPAVVARRRQACPGRLSRRTRAACARGCRRCAASTKPTADASCASASRARRPSPCSRCLGRRERGAAGRRAVTAAPRLRGRRTRSPEARTAACPHPARSLRGWARSSMLTGAPVRAGDGLVPSAACRRARRTWRAAFGDARAHATSGARVS